MREEAPVRQVRITVLKKQFYPELAVQYLTDGVAAGACPILEEGNRFIYTGGAKMPEGLCPWAWLDIYNTVSTLANGGSYYPWYNNPNQSIECCSDGIRPVVFLIEAIEPEE